MTFEEMRSLMRRKVVPEDVVPQNIIEYLMDDEAALPELDAFTFLNRLRALGIGSADFQYLLEGCGAPEECVNKVKQNPAMNLQNLILTLESSRLTAQDYTFMLYTARQIWERTLTIRLEKTETAADEDEEPDVPETEPLPEGSARSEETEETEETEEPEEIPEEESDEDSDEETEDFDDYDFGEPSLTQVLEQVRLLEEEMTYKEEPEETEGSAETEEEPENLPDEEPAPEETFPEPEEEAPAPSPVSELTGSFSKVFDIIKEKKSQPDGEDISGETEKDFTVTTILAGTPSRSDSEESSESLESSDGTGELDVSEKPENPESSEEPAEPEKIPENVKKSAVGKQRGYNGETTQLIEIDSEALKQEIAELSPEEEEPSDEASSEEEKSSAPVYNKKALIAATAGALALIGASAAAGYFAGKAPKITFAEENAEIYSLVYKSYVKNDGFTGGKNANVYTDNCEIFGSVLIEKQGFANLTCGNTVYSITSGQISASGLSGETLGAVKELFPPDNTEIIRVLEDGDSLTAVFTGETSAECGFMKIKNGSVLYTVRQDGALCGLDLSGETASIASVYVPKYKKTFSADDTAEYFPCLGINDKSPLAADKIVISGTPGCSFAVCAKYETQSGAVSEARAVFGDPISAGTDFTAAMAGSGEDDGMLISFADGIKTEKSDSTLAAFGKGFSAVCENDMISIKNADFKTVSMITNLAEKAAFLRIDENRLLVGGEKGVFAAVDCSDPANPVSMVLAKASGLAAGANALIIGPDGVDLTYITEENGALKTLGRYEKKLSGESAATLELGGVKTAAFGKDTCGMAYKYFDGVSVVSEYAVFGAKNSVSTLFDDKTGYTEAYAAGGEIYAVSSKGAEKVSGS